MPIEMNTEMNLVQRLLAIEAETPVVKKTGTNEMQGGWKYMEHSEIVATLRPLLVKYRVKYLYTEESNIITPQQGWDKDAKQVVPRGAKSQKRVKHLLINIDNPEEIFEGYTDTEANSTSDKASNASSTYGHKLFFLRTFNLSDADPDAEAIEATPINPKSKLSTQKETDIYTMLERIGTTVEEFEAKKLKGRKLTELTNSEADAWIQELTRYIMRARVSSDETANADN